MGLVPLGFRVDKAFTDPIYRKADDPIKIKYIEVTQATNRVLAMKDAHGNIIQKERNGKTYKTKGLAYCFDGEMPTEKEIVEFVNETICPAILEQMKSDEKNVRENWIDEKNLPKMKGHGKDDVYEADCWADILADPADAFYIADDNAEDGLHAWLLEDKNHLYNLFKKGEVPSK